MNERQEEHAERGEPEDDVHTYAEGSIEEGNKAVPRWLLVVMAGLLVVAVYYVVTYVSGVQPSAAGFK